MTHLFELCPYLVQIVLVTWRRQLQTVKLADVLNNLLQGPAINDTTTN